MTGRLISYGVLFVFACCVFLQAGAQVSDTLDKQKWQKQVVKEKKDFEKLFSRELKSNSTGEKKDAFIAPTGNEKLPRDLFHSYIRQTCESSVVLGISDPFMDSLQGLKLAKHRAKLVFAVLNGSMISYVTDLYVNEEEMSKNNNVSSSLEEFGKIKAEKLKDFTLDILDVYRTRYNETIVIASKESIPGNARSSKAEDSLSYISEFYRVNDRVDQHYKYRYLINYHTYSEFFSDSSDNMKQETSYLLYNIRNCLKIQTKALDTSRNLDSMYLSYQMDTVSAPETLPSYSLNKGLWAGYISALMSNIFFEAGISRSKLKNVSELYQSNVQDLKRNISRNKFSFRVKNMYIIDNKLYINLQLRENIKK